MKSDSAVSEISGFLLIVSLLLIASAVFFAAALPQILAENERAQNEALLFSFAEAQEEMTSFALAEERGISGSAEFADPRFGKARLSLSYGKPVSFGGTVFREAVITYAAENPASQPLRLTLDSAGLKKNGKLIIPAAYGLAVNSAETDEQMEITGPFTLEYTWQETFSAGGRTYQVFSVRLA